MTPRRFLPELLVVAAAAGLIALFPAYAQDPKPDPKQEPKAERTPDKPAADPQQKQTGMPEEKSAIGAPAQSPREVMALLDRTKVTFPQLIQTGEQRSGGKACAAAIMEWRCVSDVALREPAGGDLSPEELKKLDPTHPVANIVCVTNDRVTETIVCCASGKALAAKQSTQFVPGESAFFPRSQVAHAHMGHGEGEPKGGQPGHQR